MKLATGMKRYTWATSANVRPIDVMCSVSSGMIADPAVERPRQHRQYPDSSCLEVRPNQVIPIPIGRIKMPVTEGSGWVRSDQISSGRIEILAFAGQCSVRKCICSRVEGKI